MIIVPPDVLDAADRKALEENGVCVVVAKDPAKVRFMDPLPAASSRTQIEQAAIKFSRILLHRQWGKYNTNGLIGTDTFARIYVDCLVEGTALDQSGTVEEQEQRHYDSHRRDELARIAREDARAERAAKKAGQPAPPRRGRPSNAEVAAKAAATEAAK